MYGVYVICNILGYFVMIILVEIYIGVVFIEFIVVWESRWVLYMWLVLGWGDIVYSFF